MNENSKLMSLPPFFRSRDATSLGISRTRLKSMVQRGEIERVGWGTYQRSSAPKTQHQTIALAVTRVPRGIVCLLTALQVYGIGTQAPREVWIALDRKDRKPRSSDIPMKIVRFSGKMLTYAVTRREIGGIEARITTPARTIVDCFRYRRKIGLDVAMEALREALRTRQASIDEILRIAEMCRIMTVVRPYLESVAV